MASTLFFDDGGAYISKPRGYCAPYAGGQDIWGKYVAPSSALANDHAYMFSDLTNAYEMPAYNPTTRSLRYFYRAVAVMGDGAVIVWDRVRALSSAYTKNIRWHLSSLGTPVQNGSVVSNVVGSSAVFIDPVLPAAPTVTVVRNPGPTNWHVEISDSAGGTDLNAMTVLYSTVAKGTLPAVTGLSTIDSNHVGVQIADTTPKVAIFTAAVTDQGGGVYTSVQQSSVTFTSTHFGTGKYLISGLNPGSYSILLNGVALAGVSPMTVGADGTLFFAASAGSYSISLQTAAAPPSACDLNGDGLVNVLDAQIAANIQDGTTACPSVQLGSSGSCNITLAKIVDAALGKGCVLQ
jgi:hypothetical protein